MIQQRELLEQYPLALTLRRLCSELRETYGDFQDTVLLGIQPRGVFFAQRIVGLLQEMYPNCQLPSGELDVTFFRDDFRRHEHPLIANATRINFQIEKKRVILADDVLYTGRTIRAAMDALLAFGRPQEVRLLVLVERRHKRELPIQPDFCGFSIDTLDQEKVRVEWAEQSEKDSVRIEKKSPK